MTWTYINFYFFDSVNWVINLSWILFIVTLILTSFLNLLTEIAESFSIILFITLITLPQVTLLVSIHELTSTENIGKVKTSIVNLTQYKILSSYFTTNLRWITN
jgi:Zn-dependent membrane protease YugP